MYNILSVIDWEGVFVVLWELVEFAKDLSMVSLVLDRPVYRHTISLSLYLVSSIEPECTY